MVKVSAQLLAGVACLALPAAGLSQTAPAAQGQAAAKVYGSDYFARYAPKTAYDMLVQLPGFTVRQTDQSRGLGQASENILINSQRVTNKSGGALQQLQVTDAKSVDRIELVDAATLDVAGLSGQVANFILKKEGSGHGQFEWKPEFRAHYSHPNLFRGIVSYSGRTGPVDYTLSVDNNGASRGAFGGNDDFIYAADGRLIEQRDVRVFSDFDQPKMRAAAKIDLAATSVANLSVQYGPYWYDFGNREDRIRGGGDDRLRHVEQSQRGYMIDLNADYEFKLGPGRLKLIGLRHFEHEPTVTTQTTQFENGSPDDGVRFIRDARVGETVFRGEYGWKGGRNDWQLTLERAVNTLIQEGRLFTLDAGGDFTEVPFPEGSGSVAEHRYEALGTFSRPLTSKLDLQLVAGGEISKLERLDLPAKPRNFFRPKGSASLSWHPDKAWDVSLKLSRKVGQISFYDFLAQPNLSEERENAGNPDLVPPQSWELETEIAHSLGPWGRTRLRLYAHRVSDIIDIVPIGTDEQSIGNLPSAKRYGVEWKSTFQLDPIGWKGAKVDLNLAAERTRVRDPLTGQPRPISGNPDYSGSMNLRHDIPGSKLAWGGALSLYHQAKTYFLTEVGRGWEGPLFGNLFVEHKDLFGLTVRAVAGNLPNARHKFDRVVYTGFRTTNPVAFSEHQDQKIGRIFYVSVKGNF